MKAELDQDVSLGGPTLAAHALRSDVVDENRLGGGTVHRHYRAKR